MGGRNGGWKKKEDRQTAEDALGDDRAERGDAEPLYPTPRVGEPQPDHEADREKPDRAGNQPMSVFVEDPADHFREREGEHAPAVRGGQSGTERPESVL